MFIFRFRRVRVRRNVFGGSRDVLGGFRSLRGSSCTTDTLALDRVLRVVVHCVIARLLCVNGNESNVEPRSPSFSLEHLDVLRTRLEIRTILR